MINLCFYCFIIFSKFLCTRREKKIALSRRSKEFAAFFTPALLELRARKKRTRRKRKHCNLLFVRELRGLLSCLLPVLEREQSSRYVRKWDFFLSLFLEIMHFCCSSLPITQLWNVNSRKDLKNLDWNNEEKNQSKKKLLDFTEIFLDFLMIGREMTSFCKDTQIMITL